ncbi:MAG: cobyrinic acid a,c-diamide synthase, partial [Hydrogenophilales bacterium 28-61-11]
TSLTDAYATIKVLVGQQQRQTIRVIINQATRSGSGVAITNQLQQVLDRFVVVGLNQPIRLVHMGDIPLDPEVRQAIMRRQLMMQATPGCPAGVALGQIARNLEESVIPRAA